MLDKGLVRVGLK